MGSLSNLYISQSYQSLIHLGNDTSASTSLTQLQDGVGNGLGISLNTLGDLDVQRQLAVHYGAEITGAVDINTTFSGSTQPFVNQSSVNNLIRITGSYTPTGNQASISEIGIGWLVNGGAVSNARVINVSGTPNSDVTYTIDQPLTANNVSYTFTGSIQREVEIEGDLNVSDDLFVGGHLIIEDGVEITGSIDITGNVTASNALIENDLTVVGTINAFKLNVTIESSSVIFSSGSNILGDSTADTQTLNGTIIMSGSSQLTGSMTVSNDISSSTLSGVGNVTLYSQSVDQRLSSLQVASSSLQNFTSSTFVTFSQSVDSRLDFLEGPFSSSVNQQLVTLQLFTASVGLVTTASFQAFTASTNQRLNSIEIATSSLQSFSSSALISISNLNTTTASLNSSVTQLNASSASQQVSINALNTFSASAQISINSINSVSSSWITESETGSFAILANNNTYTGNNTFNKSVNGIVNALSISSNTASMDLSLGNFFTLTLASAATTRLVATNIQAGQTITLKVLQPATTGSLTYPSYIKFGNALAYSASAVANATDIVTFVTYDTTTLFAASTKNLV
jgi:hypothetical protein